MDGSDPLAQVVDIEEEFEDRGYLQGLEAGKAIGAVEGREMGCESGFGIGKDLGFYQGWVQQWLLASDMHADAVPERALKKLHEIKALLDDVPTENVEGAHFADRIKKVQQRFKVVSAMLGTNAAAELSGNTLSY
ncbi:hypothetical protein H4R99_002957 [Coemansia sp. RSA 1722]|nr:hypothetical protein LPJ57_007272 [Coemansia sp. RSA 486]KAJ2600110.1 hypothetical protein GGF39_001939 [Coemansia sp. RSA 1721]KAJ2601572.1 hypothetical protein H4R99_002957 [Coemansia sp. RSA 1722]